MGDRTNSSPSPTAVRIQTDKLLSLSYIGEFTTSGFKQPRHITLCSQAIFDALVAIYGLQFMAKWPHLETLLDNTTVPRGVTPERYLASVYISHWFIDLYVSNRDACGKHDGARSSNHYEREIGRESHAYDTFLVILLNTIKPTHVVGLPHNALYIPVIVSSPCWNHSEKNYFDLAGWHYDSRTFGAIIRHMKDPASGWFTHTVMSEPSGRIGWLLDWHEDGHAYAWFPQKGNYNDNDLTVAYILGVACTPLLGSREAFKPVQFPDNRVPRTDESFQYDYSCTDTRSFYGNCHVATIERVTSEYTEVSEIEPSPMEEESASDASAGEVDPPTRVETTRSINAYRVLEYKYYARVIRDSEIDTRIECHNILVHKE